jgi:hypothetical protein
VGFLFLKVFIDMEKIVRLTESDLTRIVKRVIKENEEKDAIEKIAKFVFSKLPKDDIEFIGNLYKELGYDKFEDTIEYVVNDDLVTERVSFSTSGFEAENEKDIEKIENIKDKVERILGFNTSTGDIQDFTTQLIGKIGVSSVIPAIIQMMGNNSNIDLEHPPLSILLVPIMIVLGGLASRAVGKTPINVSYDFDEKIRGSKFQKMIDSKLDNLNKKASMDSVIKYFEKLGIPESKIRPFIYDWEKRNNFRFKRFEGRVNQQGSKINYRQKK